MIQGKYIGDLQESVTYFPVIGLVGPRQVAKNT